jgi:hypothetical protein
MKTITKYSFAEGIAHAWNAQGNVSMALLYAAKVGATEIITSDGWDQMRQQAAVLFPYAIPRGLIQMTRPVRPFVVMHFPDAADFFWKGQPNRARKAIMLSLGVEDTGRGRNISPEERALRRKLNAMEKATIGIRLRDLSKGHDWKTVK